MKSDLKEINLRSGETASSLGESTPSIEDSLNGTEGLSGSNCSGGDIDVSTTL